MISDFKKYNRVFAFGCSFTQYIYPTYADVLAQECTNADYYNLGKTGAGNSLIAYRLAEANQRFKFNSNDLVVVMWTTSFREDRFVNHKWECHGNVYNCEYYDEHFLKKYADPNGYMIQSCAAITLGNGFVKSLPCDSIVLNSWPFFNKEYSEVFDSKYLNDCKNIYSNLYDMPISLFEYLHPDLDYKNFYLRGATYILDDGSTFKDLHPNPLAGYDYLKGIGLPVSTLSYNYAVNQTKILQELASYKSIIDYRNKVNNFDLKTNVMF